MSEPSAPIQIEKATPADAEAIMTIKRDAWRDAYINEKLSITTEDIDKKFGDIQVAIENWQRGIATETDEGQKQTFVARRDGKVVGYTSPETDDGQKRIGALYVAPGNQGNGIGTKLLQQAVDWHGRNQDIYAHVVSHNHNAVAFYEQFGFEKTGVVIPAEFDEQQGIKLLEEFEMVLNATSS